LSDFLLYLFVFSAPGESRECVEIARRMLALARDGLAFDQMAERVDSIVNMLDEICDNMDGFSSAEDAWLSSITETLRTWRYVMRETYESPEDSKND
jgi:hypothetical protein